MFHDVCVEQLISGNNDDGVSLINSFRCITCTCKVVLTIDVLFQTSQNYTKVFTQILCSSNVEDYSSDSHTILIFRFYSF